MKFELGVGGAGILLLGGGGGGTGLFGNGDDADLCLDGGGIGANREDPLF